MYHLVSTKQTRVYSPIQSFLRIGCSETSYASLTKRGSKVELVAVHNINPDIVRKILPLYL